MRRALLLVCLLAVAAQQLHRNTLLWMCLELCNSKSEILDQIKQINAHTDSLTVISYTLFGVADTQFINTTSMYNLTDVTPLLDPKLKQWPMIANNNITELRALFDNPGDFMNAAVATAVNMKYDGYNIDFEPQNATTDDAEPYMNFLNEFSDALHAVNKTLSVDVATWSPIWDYNLLAQTSVDSVITMSTYTSNYTKFREQAELASVIGPEQLGIGLGDWHKFAKDSHKVEQRIMDVATMTNLLAIWVAPIPEGGHWFRWLKYFLDAQ